MTLPSTKRRRNDHMSGQRTARLLKQAKRNESKDKDTAEYPPAMRVKARKG